MKFCFESSKCEIREIWMIKTENFPRCAENIEFGRCGKEKDHSPILFANVVIFQNRHFTGPHIVKWLVGGFLFLFFLMVIAFYVAGLNKTFAFSQVSWESVGLKSYYDYWSGETARRLGMQIKQSESSVRDFKTAREYHHLHLKIA